MTTYFDNRGVRRLSLLCDFIAKVADFDCDDAHDADNDNAIKGGKCFVALSVVSSVNEFRRMKVWAV